MLELININKNYNPGSVNELCLFKDFNLTVKDGEFVSVVGSNGSGKTSMLNIICGSIAVDSGKINHALRCVARNRAATETAKMTTRVEIVQQ